MAAKAETQDMPSVAAGVPDAERPTPATFALEDSGMKDGGIGGA